MRLGLFLAILLIAAHDAYGKTFTRCELAKELKKQGFTDLRNWVCLIEAESSRDTKALGGPNGDGSYDYGLFQINSRYWCKPDKAGGDCNIKCSELMNDDISIPSNCAKKVFARRTFTAWNGWKDKCRGKPLPDLTACGV